MSLLLQILQQAEQARNAAKSANRTAEKAVEMVKRILDELGKSKKLTPVSATFFLSVLHQAVSKVSAMRN